MKIESSGFWKKIDVKDGSLVNWLGGEVIGEEWVGRDVLTYRFRQYAIIGSDDALSVKQKPKTTVVKKRAG